MTPVSRVVINVHQTAWEELDLKDPKNSLLSASHFLAAGRVPFYFCYVLCAVLGVILLPSGNPYFFAFHLLDLVVRNALLKQVIRSVTVNIKSIILTVSKRIMLSLLTDHRTVVTFCRGAVHLRHHGFLIFPR